MVPEISCMAHGSNYWNSDENTVAIRNVGVLEEIWDPVYRTDSVIRY